MFILNKLQGYALTILAVLAVIVGAYAIGGRASRKAAEKKNLLDEALRASAGAKGAHDAEAETRRLPDGAAADQLRNEWVRDEDPAPKSTGRDPT